ncbi:MAG: FG-GAP-like repeat-containing protein [Salibacteraceae bacterium]
MNKPQLLRSFAFLAVIVLFNLPSKAQITHNQIWSSQWTPNVTLDPIGFDSITLPITPQRFGTAVFADLDNDGDKDLISGSNLGQLFIYENVGTPTNPHFQASNKIPTLDTIDNGKGQPTNEIRPVFADLDADGDLDLIVGSRWNYVGILKLDDIYYYQNTGTASNPIFQYTPLPGTANQQVAEFCSMAFGDLDNDGDLDFVAGGSDSCTYFLNVGTATNPSFQRDYTFFKPWVETSFLLPTPDLEDFDGDGDLDMYFMDEGGFIRYIPNNGTPTNPNFAPFISYPVPSLDTIDFGSFGSMTFEDIDGDGVKDFMATDFNPTAWYWCKGVPLGPTVTFTSSNATCNGNTDGTATATGGSTVGPYTYSWNSGATTPTISGLGAGTYTVVVTDSSGDMVTRSVIITEPDILANVLSVDSNVSCNSFFDGGATAAASGGTAPYTFLWSNSATTSSITGVAAGTYSATVTDANGCTDSSSIIISEPVALSVSATNTSPSNQSAFDGSATATPTGGTAPYTYIWSNSATSATVGSLGVGTYTVTVADNNGCTQTAFTQLTSGPAPTIVVDSTVACFGETNGGASSTVIGGTTPYTYLWSNGGTNSFITGINAGVYSVTVTDASGLTGVAAASITQPTQLLLSNTSSTNISCNGGANGSATYLAGGGTSPYSYAWSSGDTLGTATGLSAGTHTVTLTDANGCTESASIALTEPSALVVSTTNTSPTTPTTADGSATASASGGTSPYSYAWSNGGTTASISSLLVGTYTVTVTDNNGCTQTTSTVLTSGPSPSITVDSNVACFGESNGGASTVVTGGTTPYTYAWSNSAITGSITGVPAGTYTVTVTDASGLTGTATTNITAPSLLTLSNSGSSNLSCNNSADGSATFAGTGGTMPYSYNWSSGGATTASATGLNAGTYSVTITDANGCTDSASVTLTQPNVLVIAAVVDSNATCNGLRDGGASASATGGIMPYSYTWSSAANTASFSGVVAGTYSVTITDANGCTDSTAISITEPVVLGAAAVVDSNASCFGFTDGGATASATGGTMPYSYSWSNAATTASITGVTAGTYSVTNTDAKG